MLILKEKFENIYMLKFYLKTIVFISIVLKEYTQISDTEIVKCLNNTIELYLKELNKNRLLNIYFRLFIY